MDIQWSEIIYAFATFVVLTTYHVYWIIQLRRAPLQTYIGLAQHLRHMWVESIMTHKRDILAVQTLRNSIMASSFLASTSIIIGLGLLSFLLRPEHIAEVPFELLGILTRMKVIFLAKIMFLILHFFFAFFSFTLSIRYLNQVSFMINVPMDCEPMLTAAFISQILDRGMIHYTMGMRAYYLSGVVVLWLFGPQWMFLGSLVLVFVLYKLDHCCALDYSTAVCELKPRDEKII
jgi:uncharacterized membrane protein